MTNRSVNSRLQAFEIDKRFGSLLVLDRLSFSVADNQAVGIVGPNGAGKTTLLSVLSGSQAPTRGTVSFCGQDITDLPAAHRCRQGIVRTHQVPKPFSGMTVFENTFVAAAFGADINSQAAGERAIDALRLCDLFDLANRAGESLGLLDRKRMELARALATNPKILLLDEIGGGLTDAEAGRLVETIREIHGSGIGIVWIEHIVHILVQVVDRLICMDAGKIIAEGPPDSVMQDPAVVEAYLGGSPL